MIFKKFHWHILYNKEAVMDNLTIIIHTFNEEKNIKDCIESAKLLSKNIIVIDMQSNDQTPKIVQNLDLPIVSCPHSNYVEPAREFGIKQAKTDWVMILDADERITKELALEIKKLLVNKDLKNNYYRIPRKNIFGNVKWLRHGGWSPDYQIRLLNKKFFTSWPKRIHSTPQIKGNFQYLNNPLLHYFHGNLETMVKKTLIFEDIESDLLYRANKPVNTIIFFRKYLAELWRRMFKKLGFLDGPIGIIESVYQAFSKTITYLFLYEKKHIKKN